MITSLTVHNVATYAHTAQILSDLKTINYIFGANGSGKTTLSRVIADVVKFPACALKWDPVTQLDCLVYNGDFRDKSFKESGPVKGVFTLGEQNVQLLQQITDKQSEITKRIGDIENLTRTLAGDALAGGKKQDFEKLQDEFAETCWKQKTKHDEVFKDAFFGARNDKDKFRNRVLQEQKSNTATAIPLDNMTEKAATVFGTSPTNEAVLTLLAFDSVKSCETYPILSKPVIGSADVDIANLIKALGNGDWVSTGRPFFEKSDPKCPFCQQNAPSSLRVQLDSFFDKTYTDDCTAISALQEKYERESGVLKAALQALVDAPSSRVDLNALRAHQHTLQAVLSENIAHL